jgi:hypothetical protein
VSQAVNRRRVIQCPQHKDPHEHAHTPSRGAYTHIHTYTHRGAGTDSSRVIALAAAGLPPEVGGNSNSSSRTRGCAVGGDSLMEGRSSLVSNKRSGNSLANRGSSISCGGGSTDGEQCVVEMVVCERYVWLYGCVAQAITKFGS